MSGRAKKKGLKFIFDTGGSMPNWVSGDSIRFRQIIGNLLGNAVKFTESGEVKLAIEKYERVGEKLRYYFSIKDTGIGIAPEAIGTLFEPFTQADLSMTRKYGGTGLGLAISKQLITMMNGEVAVTSEVNQGSNFTFHVTFAEPGPFEIEKKVATAAVRVSEMSYSGHVLVVEDDPVNQRVIRLLLERIGLDVQLAENGAIGFNLAVSSTWDLIFMDCRMPVLDGIEATRKIRAYEVEHGLSHTPIVALTANAKDSDRQTCKAAGMDDFLAKPVRKPALAEILDAWLRQTSSVV
jgi:two-component system, sensor histidine kinase